MKKDSSIKITLSEREMKFLDELAKEFGYSKSRIVQEIVEGIIAENKQLSQAS